MPDPASLFHPIITLPDDIRADRYARLVGLDAIKARLRKEAAVLADPSKLTTWAARNHPKVKPDDQSFSLLKDRAPLLLFAGDVGSGKSALAESFGCDLAVDLGVEVELWRLKLSTRGSGHVGEMTGLISSAFEMVTAEAKLGRNHRTGAVSKVTIMVIDEADALVQSREATQMHHEDRAGVDAFLAEIDSLAGSGIPILVVMCTNRLAALDPAVKRRAAATFEFGRPNDDQRRQVIATAFKNYELATDTIDKLVIATGPQDTDRCGFTYSDLTQRLLPTAVLTAFPDDAITADLLLAVASDLGPTATFNDQASA
ncbi:AAA family ATPase [Prescottella equi]|uniref:AAA family ATPase n=1 Tax=Rhodococcus hoagii TaxID=43767 RepID=UPI0007CD822B|nr:ATP-binding protein [Prescottella equi]